jgi:hypothetical protein
MNTRHSKDRPLQSASGRILATDDGAESTGHPQTMADRHEPSTHVAPRNAPCNKGKLVGQKAPLKLKDIWAIRVRLQKTQRPVQFEITEQTEV